jgi:phosphoglycolate phosphatase
MRLPRAIVFDLDGTLADTGQDIAAACNYAIVRVGRAERPGEEIVGYVGDGARVLIGRVLGLAPDDPITSQALAYFNEYYPRHAADHATWMPGAREALAACARIPLAIATNKPRGATLPLLDALGLAPHFKAVYAGGDGPLKPDPAAIHTALAPLGVAAADAWVVGDGPQDVAAGKASGAGTVSVLGGFGREEALRQAGPDRCIRSLHELGDLLLRASP